jgi:hypothetical protein
VAGSPLANPVRVALYYPRNVTDALTLRYTLDGTAVTNASLVFTNDTQLGTSFRHQLSWRVALLIWVVCVCGRQLCGELPRFVRGPFPHRELPLGFSPLKKRRLATSSWTSNRPVRHQAMTLRASAATWWYVDLALDYYPAVCACAVVRVR